MRRPLLTVCALLVILFMAALRFSLPLRPEGEANRGEAATQNTTSQLPVRADRERIAPAASARDFHSDFLTLLAPFENDGDNDPFFREKRATSFQAELNKLNPSEIASAYGVASAIQATHASESAADLRDRLLQRWRELDPASIAIIDAVSAEKTSLSAEIIALSDTDPIAAARRALDQLPDNQEQTNILIGIVQRLAATDPSSALDWVEQFPEGDLRNRAFAQLRRVTAIPPNSPRGPE
jgi:hypothetical protein